MEERYLVTLEFPKIIEQLASHTSFSAGRELALRLRPATDEAEVRLRQQETTEAKALLATRTDVGVGSARDVRPLLVRASLSGMLQPMELLDVRSTLMSARRLRTLLLRLEGEHPLLAERAARLEPLPEIVDSIGVCLDDDGRVLDSASPELAHIRGAIGVARDRLLDRLRRIVASSANARYLQEPIVTERNGRYVIPLKVEFKGRIPGIVHDQSSSGATLFIEPLDTVELNNRWHELQLAEAREIERILTELSMMVGDEAAAIETDVEVLAALDVALAKGHYSFAQHSTTADIASRLADKPRKLADSPTASYPLDLIRARHPLLPHETCVPIDVRIGNDYTVLLVTGPNTGGKTVSLKTVGLLAAMFQAGLHIPVAEGSRLPVFSGIYADIGDEQSIEQSLSTFSSHMMRIIGILNKADAHSLVLLDELGAGTDPVEGQALAQALINTLLERGCLVMCSTHYAELKVFAFSTPSVQNASVEFDVDTLSPTYHLVIGLPGRSNALAIAQRLGLDRKVIERARRLVSPESLEADALLANVRMANEAAERARDEAQKQLARADQMERLLKRQLVEIDEMRRQVLEQAREEGRRDLEQLRAEVRRIRSHLMGQGRAAEAVQEATEAIERLAQDVAPLAPIPEPVATPDRDLSPGDTVYVTTLGQQGELLSVDGQEAEVRVGGFRLRTHISALELRVRPIAGDAAPQQARVGQPEARSPGMELDMRGWRAEQVAPELDKYLDSAYLAQLPWVQIIHGKGMGVLKEVVRQFLAGHPLVANYRPGAPAEGGEGVTVVELYQRSD